MDLHEKRELDLAAEVARVRAGTRPWRSMIAFALAVLAAITSWAFPHYQLAKQTGQLTADIITHATAVAFFLFALAALVGLSGKTRQLLRPVIGSAHAAVVRYTIVLAGSVIILIVTLDLLQIAVGSLVLGGAVTTILLGIAAQQSLGNLFAGIVLLLSRPFAVGDSIQVRSGAMGGLMQGTVTEIGITYVRLDTPEGALHLPNSQVLAAGVLGPVAPVSTSGQPFPGQPFPGQPPSGQPASGAPASGPQPPLP